MSPNDPSRPRIPGKPSAPGAPLGPRNPLMPWGKKKNRYYHVKIILHKRDEWYLDWKKKRKQQNIFVENSKQLSTKDPCKSLPFLLLVLDFPTYQDYHAHPKNLIRLISWQITFPDQRDIHKKTSQKANF